jgi:alanine racemase
MVMIKADGYGHGMLKVAKAVAEAGAQWLGVALAEEGAELRENGINTPILITGPLCSPAEVVKYDLRQSICSSDDILRLNEQAISQQKYVFVHIKVDTGMNRIGIKGEEQLIEVLNTIKACPAVVAEGIFTHFASADGDEEFTHYQAAEFMKACATAERMGVKLIRHAANSAAICLYKPYHFDLVRPGIITYGYPPVEVENCSFKPVFSLKAAITFVKDIRPGDSVSYNRTFIADRPMRIATIAAGYGDGYRRSLSNQADCLIHGQRARILGNVCMDQMMADVTDIPNVVPGDEAVLIGGEGKNRIGADELARLANTISYEIMLSVTGRVPKIYINE